MRSVLHTAIALAIVSLAYFSVDDELRPVITTRKAITDQRIEAGRTAINATEPAPCSWRDIFDMEMNNAHTRATSSKEDRQQ